MVHGFKFKTLYPLKVVRHNPVDFEFGNRQRYMHLSLIHADVIYKISWNDFCCITIIYCFYFSYFVRVVSTELDTTVTWETEDNVTNGRQVVTRGDFAQIYNPLASQTMRIICDKACLVMQYNPGMSHFTPPPLLRAGRHYVFGLSVRVCVCLEKVC